MEKMIDIKINDSVQRLLIRFTDLKNPVLLFLHGGPGLPTIPESHLYSDLIIHYFTLVHWDQRGAGFSYSKDNNLKDMTLDRFVEDAREVTRYLLKEFGKEKIYLLGYSWGSVLGTHTYYSYPELFGMLICVGQFVNDLRARNVQLEWLKKKLNTHFKEKMLEDNEELGRLIIENGGCFGKELDYVKVLKDSPYSTSEYLEQHTKGMEFSVKAFASQRPMIDMVERLRPITVPICFLHGRLDYMTPGETMHEYFKLIDAPKKEVVWFEKSSHTLMLDEPLKFQEELIRLLRKYPIE